MRYTLEFPTDAHLGQISAIWETGWHEAHAAIVPSALCEFRTSKSFHDRTLENLATTRIATDGSEVLGFCMVKKDELYQMYVSANARGSGVARLLIEDAENRISVAGHRTAWLACAIGNDRASRFYEKSGWANAGRRIVELETSKGAFPLEVWRFEKQLRVSNTG